MVLGVGRMDRQGSREPNLAVARVRTDAIERSCEWSGYRKGEQRRQLLMHDEALVGGDCQQGAGPFETRFVI